jgi:predicted nucleotidyltransferase
MDHSSQPQLNFDLTDFETAIHGDLSVLGLLYIGSLGRGTADRYSDLDIEVWVPDEDLEIAFDRLRALLETLGTVQFTIFRELSAMRGFVGPDWRRVELHLMCRDELQPSPKFAEARIVKDIDGVLERLIAESPRELVQPTWMQMRQMIEEAIDGQIYLALHNARGASWSAMGEVSYRLSELYTLLSRLRGYRSYGFRYVETELAPYERDLLAASWPTSAEQAEVRRAARALWEWTRHVWSEAEVVLGSTLEITIDESAFLAAVDRIYAEAGGESA